jgi:hypothetical protein
MFKFEKEFGEHSKIRFHARVHEPKRRENLISYFVFALLNDAFEINKFGEESNG